VLANRLVATATDVGIATVLLRVDDFRRPVDWRRPGRSEAEIYYDDYYDLPLLDRCLQAFGEGAPSVEIPTFDSTAEQIDGSRTIAYGGAALAIVEGVFTLRVSALSARAAVIHLQTSFPEAHRRIVTRDTARGRSLADVTHRITARYFPSQERYLRDLDPRSRADVIVDNERLGSPQVLRFDQDRLGSVLAGALWCALGDFATPRTVE
jgi:uridine kinase